MFCMTCSANNSCGSCFNWGSGTVGARSLGSSTCTTALSRTMTDAKYYSGTHTNTSAWAMGSAVCKDSSKYQYLDMTIASPYSSVCQSTTISGVTRISNCKFDVVNKTGSTTYTTFCLMCDKNKGGVCGLT